MPLHPAMLSARCLLRRFVLCLLAAAPAAWARQPPPCPPPPAAAAAAASGLRVAAERGETVIEAQRVHTDQRTGASEFTGAVRLRRDGQRLSADTLRYDRATDRAEAHGAVRLETPQGDVFTTDTLHLQLAERIGASGAGEYVLGRVNARGDAARIEFAGPDRTILEQARYTTCPAGQDDWFLELERLELDTDTDIGTARHARVRFLGLPVFYFPYLNFPISQARKSGFLMPRVGRSDKSGAELAVPYYFNLAPNYDDTLTPRFLAKRGLQLQNEFRYLTPRASGRVDLEVLPDDDLYGDDRAALHLRHQHTFDPYWSAAVELRGVSDKQYLEDFGDRLEIAAQTHLPQNAELNYRSPLFAFTARVNGYQTVDRAIPPLARPYARLPQLWLATNSPLAPNRLNAQFEGEWVNFERDAGVRGTRLNAASGLSLPLAASWGFLTPRASVRHIAYDLKEAADDTPSSVTRGVFSLDGGLFFERATRFGARPFTQTLEPRLFYLYVPYRDQDRLPNFDTGVPDLSFESLFREQRLVGGDRIADANQLAAALTSRFLDDRDGSERLRLALGSIYYFADRRVNVPAGTLTQNSSDLLAEAVAWLPANVAARAFVQWDRRRDETARASLYFQHMPARDRIVNLGYQFIRGSIEQLDASAEWPLAARWTLRARSIYSLRDDRNLESYAGVVYHTCCWALRVFASRRLSEGTTQVSGIHLELELTGLGKLGEAPASPLDQGLFRFQP